jgi:hypothetical protein
VLAAVSAPYSLAVDLASQSGLTLVAFLRDDSTNVYARPERVVRRATTDDVTELACDNRPNRLNRAIDEQPPPFGNAVSHSNDEVVRSRSTRMGLLHGATCSVMGLRSVATGVG